ncbi:MAG TPA: CDP-glycerol glycerophosphotransferase family protein [Aeromicrobium sp.]|nr:CDP-glycerol glycerophosphotransferase family protein [Aeromicrobium sp.]HKY58882.1 CDP-glycerol glycerophosphotransferase family protein [Aeromicrobium sp.]
MASFTFGTGNARKIAGLPLYLIGGLTSLFVPRSRKLWVYGSGVGLGEGALPLYQRGCERLPDQRHIWMARTKAEFADARARGMDVVRKNGVRGWWLTARAKVIVVTHGFGDANRYAVRGGFVVQLWHGLPFKHLHLDSPSTYQVAFLPDLAIVRRLLGWAYRRAGRAISLFPVASERVRPSFVSGFGARPENVVVLGDVRDDVLLVPDAAAEAAGRVRELLSEQFHTAKVILFAPTWRDGADDPTVPTDDEWHEISDWLTNHDAVLLVRNHPLGRGDFSAGPAHSDRVVLIGPEVVTDLNPLLAAVAAVITDYSSLVFDYALVGGPVVHFTPDLTDYTTRRGFYLPVTEFTGGHTRTTWSGTLRALSAALTEGPEGPAHRQAAHLRQDFFDVLEPGAADRVIDAVLARTARRTSAAEPPAVPLVRRPVVSNIGFHQATGTLRILGLPSAKLVGALASVQGEDYMYPLLQSRWGSEPLALPSGTYRLVLPDGSRRLQVTSEPLEIRHELFHATVFGEAGGLAVQVRAPLEDGIERGARAQKALERAYRRGRRQPEDAVFFESFRGRSVACNPRALDRFIAADRPNTRRYWSVQDGSVEVPIGAIRVIEGTRAWWHARGSARVLVVNDWLQKRWRRRSHQHVLQTWHGSTLKRLARDRPDAGWRTRVAARLEGKRWDALLAQNEFSALNLRSAYAYKGPVWIEGYPRNDALARSFQYDRSSYAIYHRLGIDPNLKIVLWAPTWREDRRTMVDFLDVGQLSSLLGPEWIILVRGHVSTWGTGTDQSTDGVLDVTTYPDITDLLQVTDVLVTDYSSVMFDWVVTGRPIVFFVPDMANYAYVLRGFYADLLEDPPGPVVRTTTEVAAAIETSGDHSREYAEQRREWHERFAAHDNGHAAENVVKRMLEAGWLSGT